MLFESYPFAVVRKRVTNLQRPQNVRRWSTRAVSPKLRSSGRRRAATRICLVCGFSLKFIEEKETAGLTADILRYALHAREIREKHARYFSMLLRYAFISRNRSVSQSCFNYLISLEFINRSWIVSFNRLENKRQETGVKSNEIENGWRIEPTLVLSVCVCSKIGYVENFFSIFLSSFGNGIFSVKIGNLKRRVRLHHGFR